MIPKKDQFQIYEEIYHLQNCELAMGEYYQQIAERLYEERLFWEEAISDEVNHARLIGKLIAMISAKPGKFIPGKYRVAVLETFLSGIYAHIEQIKEQKLTRSQIYKTALDYESSLLMIRPFDIVESSDPEFRIFKEAFAQETQLHSNRIRQYIQQKLSGSQSGTGKIVLRENTQ